MNKIVPCVALTLVGFGIYLAWHVIVNLFTAVTLLSLGIGRESLVALCVVLILAAVACAIVIGRRRLAAWIVRKVEMPETDTPINWVSAGLTLISVGAGLTFLPKLVSAITGLLLQNRIVRLSAASDSFMPEWAKPLLELLHCGNIERFTYTFVLFAVAIYLLCGAPRFVRWHTKKIFEQFSDAERDE